MKIIEKITEFAFFKTLIERINDLIDNSNEFSSRIDGISSDLGNLADATPLIASSVAGMVDTTKLYVNTSNGYVYYYTNRQWTNTGILYTGDVSETANKVDKLEEETNTIKEVVVSEKQLDCFGKQRQRKCIFYDTFNRIDGKGFGNTDSEFTWDENCASHVSIIDKKLVLSESNRNVVLTSKPVKNDFAVETVFLTDVNSIYSLCVLCKDRNNGIWITATVGEGRLSTIITRYQGGSSLRLGVVNGVSIKSSSFATFTVNYYDGYIFIYVDGLCILSCPVDISGLGDRVGLSTREDASASYVSFSVFEFRDFITYDASIIRGKQPYNSSLFPTGTTGYGVTDGQNSPSQENFTLKRSEVTDNSSAHVCVLHNTNLQTPLKHTSCSFDLYIPEEFISDPLDEVIFQFHGRNNDKSSNGGFVQTISINIKEEHFDLLTNGSDDRNIQSNSEVVMKRVNNLGGIQITPNTWYHFDINIVEGCSVYHNPSVIVNINGRYAGYSDGVNQYNEDLASFLEYGPYKWSWVDPTKIGLATERRYSFANMKYTY